MVAAILVLGWVVMLLWNAILPDLIHVNALTYPKAIGLLLLCKILFGSFRPGPPRGFRKDGHPWRSKLMNLSEEERDRFRKEWHNRWKKNPDELK
jgi:hypothetical protein